MHELDISKLNFKSNQNVKKNIQALDILLSVLIEK